MKTIPIQSLLKQRGNFKFLALIALWVTFGWSGIIRAQNITGAEYFFDTDPGFGNATAVAITPAPDINNLNLSIDITGLSPGFHYLCFRVKDDSASWSLTQRKYFYKESVIPTLPNIVAVEYFIDNDPGFGNGTPVSVTPATHLDNLNFTVDISGLSAGFHYLRTRVKDAQGKWSLVQSTTFLKGEIIPSLPDIVKAEYFIDTEPGLGNGTDIPLTPATNLTGLNFVIDISQLNYGFHNLICRVKDAYGKWSLTSSKFFYKEQIVLELPKITDVEYFIDNDPGFGNGTQVPIVAGINKTVNWVVNIVALTPGFHTLYTRVKDSLGHWSLTNARPFYKDFLPLQLSKIKKVEYYIDSDPGFGNAVDVPFTQDSSLIELGFTIDIHSLAQGFHQLMIRAKDARGKWSLTQVRPFYKQVFYDTLPELVQVEYFYDFDPGFGNGHQVTFTPASQIPFLAWSLDLSNVEFGQHQLYIRTKDIHGKWSLAARDTIFYYLDSLPTASLSGPTSFCINASGEFEVTLTGTPPWTLIYNTGEDIDTVPGIMVSPYTFTVSPTYPGTHTAQVLKVQDVYYTGLYTGIPIEYEVNPLPAAAGTVYGPENVCLGTGPTWYWIYGVTNASSYTWSVPQGAAIVSNPNTNSILVDFTNVTASGVVSVTPVNYCGQGVSSLLQVNIRPHPLVDAGPDLFLPYNGSDTLAAVVTGGTEPYNYYWSPWYYLNNAYLPNPIATPASTTTFTVQVTDTYGCSGTDQMIIYVGLPEGTIVSGNFSYDNSVNTPMTNSLVTVKQGNTVIASDTTDNQGDFIIPGVPAGYYYLTGTTDKPWGGANATDALLVLQHYVEMITLAGLRYEAANVTASYGINASDAFLIAKRYTGLTTSFPAGDWYSDTKYFTAAPAGTINENLEALCFGDVDGSHIPGAKSGNGVEITNYALLTVPSGQFIDIPVLATSELEVGALSLSLDIPDNIQVTGVKPGMAMLAGDFVNNVVNDQLKIAWYSLNTAHVSAGEAVLWITCRISRSPEQNWASSDGSVMANGMGQELDRVIFNIPKVSSEASAFELFDNYPNPFSDKTTINYYIPEDGLVSLQVFSTVGQEVTVLQQNETLRKGTYSLVFEPRDLPSGIYYYTLTFKGQTISQVQTRKMVIQQ